MVVVTGAVTLWEKSRPKMEVNSVVQKSKFVYPVARREENVVDDYHGQKVNISPGFRSFTIRNDYSGVTKHRTVCTGSQRLFSSHRKCKKMRGSVDLRLARTKHVTL